VINIHKLDNADKALNKDMQTNNETEHVCTVCTVLCKKYQLKIVCSYTLAKHSKKYRIQEI